MEIEKIRTACGCLLNNQPYAPFLKSIQLIQEGRPRKDQLLRVSGLIEVVATSRKESRAPNPAVAWIWEGPEI